MEITLDCGSARDALDQLSKITGADHANFEINKEDIFFTASGNNKSIRLLVKSEITKKSKTKGFGFNIFTLQSLLKGRAELAIKYDGTDVSFSSTTKGSKFAGAFHPLPYENISVLLDEDAEKVDIKGSMMASLLDAVKRVSISNIYTQEDMTLFVRVNKNGLFTTIYDNYHLAFCHNESVTSKKEINFSLTLPLFDTIGAVAREQDYTLNVGSVYVSATGLGFEISLPIMQTMDGLSFEQSEGALKDIDFKGSKRLDISMAELKQTLDNLGALSDGSSGITIEDDKGKIKFSLKSGFGNASEKRSIKLTDWEGSKFVLSPTLFLDTVSPYGSNKITLHFTKDAVSFKEESGKSTTVYSCLLL